MGDQWCVKFDGPCARCGRTLVAGTPATWDRQARRMHCIECPPAEAPPPPATPAPTPEPSTEAAPAGPNPAPEINAGVAGRSARAEHDRREAKRQAAITETWGTGFVAKVVRTFSVEPQSTRAWAIGAAGEEQLAEALATVPSLRVLNDRRVPGTRANIDHIVIGPAGVFVVDAKNHQGTVAIVDRGGFLRADHRLTVGGRDHSTLADAMTWQVTAVTTALQGLELTVPPVVPVLCFVRADWPWISPPSEFRGVRLEGPRSLKKLVTATSTLTEEAIDAVAAHLAQRLPPK